MAIRLSSAKGLVLGLNLSLKNFSGVELEQNRKYSKAQLQLGLYAAKPSLAIFCILPSSA